MILIVDSFFWQKIHHPVVSEIVYRASHIRFISEFILYATKNTDDADSLIPFIM
jgi:hypothetical protein